MESHTFKSFYSKDSKVLILGSFPSVKSREDGFYYAHPANRFWKVLEAIYDEKIFNEIEAKKLFLKKHYIALYDVIDKCDIINSSDGSIKNIVPTNIEEILNNSNINLIVLNGSKASELYYKYNSNLKIKVISLPSTSSANARYRLDDLVNEYKIIKVYTKC